jgi:hypothetical protein
VRLPNAQTTYAIPGTWELHGRHRYSVLYNNPGSR